MSQPHEDDNFSVRAEYESYMGPLKMALARKNGLTLRNRNVRRVLFPSTELESARNVPASISAPAYIQTIDTITDGRKRMPFSVPDKIIQRIMQFGLFTAICFTLFIIYYLYFASNIF